MEITDILVLAKAGFNAQQIAALASVQPTAQIPVTTPAPTAAPATVPAPATAPAIQPESDKIDEIMKQLGVINQTMQTTALTQATMPKEESVSDILASIINPPDIVGKKGD